MGRPWEDEADSAELKTSTAVVPDCSLECPGIDALSKMAAAPKYTFGAKSREVSEKDASIPGPGSYYESYRDELRGKTGPKFSFGGATRRSAASARVPGPGEYVCRTFLDNSKGFSCTPRRSESGKSKFHRTPGPGAHNVPIAFALNGPRHSMTPRRTAAMAAEERQRCGVGPGQYEPATEILAKSKPPKWGFGSAPRIADLGPQSTPGPGAYRHEVNLNGKGPKYSMRARNVNQAKVGLILEKDED